MFYYFKDKHKLLEVKLEFKEHNYMFKSQKMELYSVQQKWKQNNPCTGNESKDRATNINYYHIDNKDIFSAKP